MSSGSYVYTGTWINWTNGQTLGATLTLNARDAAFLIAALALFVRMVGSRLWSILKFVVHQSRSSRHPRDGLHHQQQAVLRNTSSSISTIWQLLKTCFFWRSHARKPFLRSLPLILPALLHLIAFVVAGIFSSRVATTTGEVLIRGGQCGIWNDPNFDAYVNTETTVTARADYEANYRNDLSLSSNYVQSCYNTTSSLADSSTDCNVYAKTKISWSTVYNASCPFAPEMCAGPANGAIALDTGILDSDKDLGINAPPEDRVTYRRRMTCTPLITEGFTSDWEDANYNSSGRPDNGTTGFDIPAGVKYFYYGPQVDYFEDNNYTSWISNFSVAGLVLLPEGQAYSMDNQVAFAGAYMSAGVDESTFNPIPQLNRTDGDVNLVFLSSNALYTQPVDDPIFYAQQKTNDSQGDGVFYYVADLQEPTTVLACVEQHQVCNPALPSKTGCTSLTGILLVNDLLSSLDLNDRQLATVELLRQALGSNLVNDVTQTLETSSLLATNTLSGIVSAGLPKNQWTIEVSNWFAIVMANSQRLVVEYATGPSNLAYMKYVQEPTTTEGQTMCTNMKIRSTGHISFSILALAVVFAIGIVIIGISIVLDSVVGYIQNWKKKGEYRRMNWILDGTLQLQRMAYEGNGLGTWQNCADEIPVTKLGERFRLPLGYDREHPTLGTPADNRSVEMNPFLGLVDTKAPMTPSSRSNTFGTSLRESISRVGNDESTSVKGGGYVPLSEDAMQHSRSDSRD
ncbi:MAG: hypothetical protein M1827_004573 [Pycnora praestabilis]|nr:MAG: hypothetical protein M1827_004573 [Pycnora praestabilis]